MAKAYQHHIKNTNAGIRSAQNIEEAVSVEKIPARTRWGEKRYYSLDCYMKETYGKKLYKIALDGGFTCPNRDGTLGYGGCIFCSSSGSGDFAGDRKLSVTSQLEAGKALLAKKYQGGGYIAYFQSYTGTYGPLSKLRKVFTEAIRHPDVEILSIATRPDCLPEEVLSLLQELSLEKPVWVELGLQTIHEKSADFIRRGYRLPVFEQAVKKLNNIGIPVIVHIILGLPSEDTEAALATIRYLNALDIQGVKLQLLHILEGTDLADIYRRQPFPVMTLDEYLTLLSKCISNLRPDIVIHRFTGDGPKHLLVEPKWTADKRMVLNRIQSYLKSQDIWQGRSYINGRITHSL
ncbi:MAG: TIGR01212 family radical SAM protein [Dorea sp.]|nr:TIGR01212 family radical SAM protein [Dorea sp.]